MTCRGCKRALDGESHYLVGTGRTGPYCLPCASKETIRQSGAALEGLTDAVRQAVTAIADLEGALVVMDEAAQA